MPTHRRTYLKALGGAGIAGLSGCLKTIGIGSNSGPIKMGSILPLTGSLAEYGKPMQGAANLAAKDINDAGGPLGRELSFINKDGGTNPNQALQKYSALVNEENIIGFVGGVSSAVSVPLSKRAADDGIMEVSNASTSPQLSYLGYADNGLKYFGRPIASNALQSVAMVKVLTEDKYIGADKIGFLYVNNPFGQGLAEYAKNALEAGSFDAEVVASVPYSPKQSDYTSALDALFAENPDGIGFVGYPDAQITIMQQWANGDYGGTWVWSQGGTKVINTIPDIVEGFYTTSGKPAKTKGVEKFGRRFDRAGVLYVRPAYDALMLQALAIHRAGEASGTAISKNIREVSRPSGEKVTVGEFEKAKQLLDEGNEINYEGAYGPVDLNKKLEVFARQIVSQVQDGKAKPVGKIPPSFFEGKVYH